MVLGRMLLKKLTGRKLSRSDVKEKETYPKQLSSQSGRKGPILKKASMNRPLIAIRDI